MARTRRDSRTYSEKLKDPRWQRVRLLVLDRANFACESCQADDKTLHVHHRLYKRGSEPWEYSDDELECLCETCHSIETQLQRDIEAEIQALRGQFGRELLGFLRGLRCKNECEDVEINSYEEAVGIGCVFGLEAETVIERLHGNVARFDDLDDYTFNRTAAGLAY